jgi:hypothetical protein
MAACRGSKQGEASPPAVMCAPSPRKCFEALPQSACMACAACNEGGEPPKPCRGGEPLDAVHMHALCIEGNSPVSPIAPAVVVSPSGIPLATSAHGRCTRRARRSFARGEARSSHCECAHATDRQGMMPMLVPHGPLPCRRSRRSLGQHLLFKVHVHRHWDECFQRRFTTTKFRHCGLLQVICAFKHSAKPAACCA